MCLLLCGGRRLEILSVKVESMGGGGGGMGIYWLNLPYTALVDSSPHVSPMHGAYGPETLCPSISICAASWLFGRHGASSLEKVL